MKVFSLVARRQHPLRRWLSLQFVVACIATACAVGTDQRAGSWSSADSAPALVQLNYATPQDASSSVGVVYVSPQQSGDLNVVVVGWDDITRSIASVSDSKNGTPYKVAAPTTRSSSNSQAIYYLPAIQAAPANSVTVTVAFDGPAAFPDVRIAEYSGLSGALEPNPAAATGAGSEASAGPITVTSAPELVFAAGTTTGSFGAAGNGFKERVLTLPDADIVEDLITTAPGAYTATVHNQGEFVMQAVGFKGVSSLGDSGAPVDSASDSAHDTGPGPDASLDSPPGHDSSLDSAPIDSGGSPTGPTLVQHDSSSSTRDVGLGNVSPFCYYFELPNPTTAGNAVIVGFTFGGSPAPTVTDDGASGGNNYQIVTTFPDGPDGGDTRSIGIAAAFGVAAGARNISLCFDADPGGQVQPMATEFANVIGVDGAPSAASGSGTVASAGTLTPTTAGDLVYQVVVSRSGSQSSFAAGSGGNVSWGLLSADVVDGWAAQYGVDSASGPIDPGLGLGSSDRWISAAVLLKPGSSGSVPPGLRIVHLVHENLPFTTPAGGNLEEFPSPLAFQFPSSGNRRHGGRRGDGWALAYARRHLRHERQPVDAGRRVDDQLCRGRHDRSVLLCRKRDDVRRSAPDDDVEHGGPDESGRSDRLALRHRRSVLRSVRSSPGRDGPIPGGEPGERAAGRGADAVQSQADLPERNHTYRRVLGQQYGDRPTRRNVRREHRYGREHQRAVSDRRE
jgi:hypothetical protein